MNQSQLNILLKLKNKIGETNLTQSPLFDDRYLLRFCRAREFNFDLVWEMFSNFIKWRNENDIDNILVAF